MSLSRAPLKYEQRDQDRLRADLEKMDGRNRKTGQDVEIVGGERLILSSPNGTRWQVVVNDAGALSAVSA